MTWADILIVLNLFVLESLLSVDNAAVLATMVSHLPEGRRQKALRYGILGAFLFRGLALFLASYIMNIIWLKALGGLYLLYLSYKYFISGDGEDNKESTMKGFWMTVILVELADMAFSIDNVFAAVALSNKLYLVLVGVFMGIVTMRFIAGWFVKVMSKHPSLKTSAFIVVGLLGAKLCLSTGAHYFPEGYTIRHLDKIMDNSKFDMIFSSAMMLIFFIPVTKALFSKK